MASSTVLLNFEIFQKNQSVKQKTLNFLYSRFTEKMKIFR